MKNKSIVHLCSIMILKKTITQELLIKGNFAMLVSNFKIIFNKLLFITKFARIPTLISHIYIL